MEKDRPGRRQNTRDGRESEGGTDDEDPQGAAAKGQALRAAARRQAHKKRDEASLLNRA